MMSYPGSIECHQPLVTQDDSDIVNLQSHLCVASFMQSAYLGWTGHDCCLRIAGIWSRTAALVCTQSNITLGILEVISGWSGGSACADETPAQKTCSAPKETFLTSESTSIFLICYAYLQGFTW